MKSNKGSKTLTIGELYLQIRAMDLTGLTLDTAVASEFEVVAEYTYQPGLAYGQMGGAMEDGDPGFDEDVSIKVIKTSAAVHFEGDAGDVTIKRGTDIKELFTSSQIGALEDRILAAIKEASKYD